MPIRVFPVRRGVSLAVRVLCLVAVVLTGAHLPLARPGPAGAAVTRVAGFVANVDGWESWYGSYGMDDIGHAWCIDHGIRAPDPSYEYMPTSIDAPTDVQRGLAWILGRHGRAPGRVTAAALMLATHDLMGAVYPSGPLDVDVLDANRMSGFDGAESAVLDRARKLKAEALAHRHLKSPITLEATVAPASPHAGERGVLRARLADSNGSGVGGIVLRAAVSGAVLTGAVEAPTAADGTVELPFVAVEGANEFEVTGTVPDLALQAFRPTRRVAQRVARPAVVPMRVSAEFTAVATRELTIAKTGDAEAYLPVVGARFEARGGDVVAPLKVDGRGRATTELPAGRYEIHEVGAPEGYEPAGPWTIDLTHSDQVLEVENRAQRGRAVLRKVDSVTGERTADAELAVRYDADADGTYETDIATHVSRVDAPIVFDDLLPGYYVVEEVAAPPGYGAAEPVRFDLPPGGSADVVVVNHPRSTVSFRKTPGGPHDPEAMTLEGARFEVAGAGECTTGPDGSCTLPADMLDGGTEYCWNEVVAPPGWGSADGGCFTASAEPGGLHEVEVIEPSRYAAVLGTKVDGISGELLDGAAYDLYRVDDAALGGAPSRPAPAGAVLLEGHTWVGRAASDGDGRLVWPVQISGYSYCALELEAPTGYLPDAELTCTQGPLGMEGATLELADLPVPVEVERTATTRVVHHIAPAPAPASAPAPRPPQSQPELAPAPPSAPLAATGLGSLRLTLLAVALIAAGLALINSRQ